MGRWADAFQAHIQPRDTADTADTSSGNAAALGQSVNSVRSVTPKKEPDTGHPHPLPTLCPKCQQCHAFQYANLFPYREVSDLRPIQHIWTALAP